LKPYWGKLAVRNFRGEAGTIDPIIVTVVVMLCACFLLDGEKNMPKQVIISDNAPKPVACYSQGILVDNTLYVQGVIALNPKTNKLIEGGIEVQTHRVFESIKAIIEKAGFTMADVVKVTAFLATLDDYPRFNALYGEYFKAAPPPVRTTVQVKLPFNALVEVDVIAAR
jgi:2-iminobutanoate/2-iminopropanoate deaminase